MLPSQCPTETGIQCNALSKMQSSNSALEELSVEPNTPEKGNDSVHSRMECVRKEKTVPLVDTELRRSLRIKDRHRGYKTDCRDKNCLACSATPPSLTLSVIKNLGSTFCKMKPSALSDEVLSRKKKKQAPISKKKEPDKTVRAKKKDKDTNEDKTNKKSRK